MSALQSPLVIEAAICPFRADAPVTDMADLVEEAKACLAAGAHIIHFHHDTRLGSVDAVDALIGFGREVLASFPSALLYPGILGGRTGAEHTAHLVPMADAGVLGLAPLDPGAAVPYDLTDDGLPTGHGYVWNSFSSSKRVAADMLARSIPITVGVYEPTQLRWALAMSAAGKLAAGSMLKLYFGGSRSLFRIGSPALNFGLPPTVQALEMYRSMMADSSLPWVAGVMGDGILDLPLGRAVVEAGGHLRVGIEDLACVDGPTNVETVEAAVALAHSVGRPVASASEVASILGLTR